MNSAARHRLVCVLAIASPLVWADTSWSQVGKAKPKPDPRVEAIMAEQDIKYSIDKDGDFRVVFDVGDGRSQLAFIRSTTSRYDDLEIREILSVAYRSENDEFPPEVANALLEDSYTKKLGAWGKQGGTAAFVVRIAADADGESLRSALKATLKSADAMEQRLTGDKDAF